MARYTVLESQTIPTEILVMKDFPQTLHPPKMSEPLTPKKGIAALTEGLTTEKKLDRYPVM